MLLLPLCIIAAAEPDIQYEDRKINIERGRAWRRFKSQSKSRRNSSSDINKWKPEKNWKMMYLRSEKLARAKQLGVNYPRRTIRQVLDNEQPLK